MGACASVPRNSETANRPSDVGSDQAGPAKAPSPPLRHSGAAFDGGLPLSAVGAAATASSELNNTLLSLSQQPSPHRYIPLPLPSAVPQNGTRMPPLPFSPHPPSRELRPSQDTPSPHHLLTALSTQSSSASRLKLTALPPLLSPNNLVSRGNSSSNNAAAMLLALQQNSCTSVEFGPIFISSSFDDSSDEEENAATATAGPSSFYYEFLRSHGDASATAKSTATHTPSAHELLRQRQASAAGRGRTPSSATSVNTNGRLGGSKSGAALPNSLGNSSNSKKDGTEGDGRALPGPVDPAIFIPALNTYSREKAATHFFIDDDGEVRRLYRTAGWHRLKPERAGSVASSSSSVESKVSSPPSSQGLVRHPSYDGLIFSSIHLNRVWSNETGGAATHTGNSHHVKSSDVEQSHKPSKSASPPSSSSNKASKSSSSGANEHKPAPRRTRSDITELSGRNGGGSRFTYRRGIDILASPPASAHHNSSDSASQRHDKAFPRSPILLKSGSFSRRGSRSSLKYEISDDDDEVGTSTQWSDSRLESSTATRPPHDDNDDEYDNNSDDSDEGRRHGTRSLKRRPSLTPKQKPRVRFTNGTEYFPGGASTAKVRSLTHTSEEQERESWRANEDVSDSDTVMTEDAEEEEDKVKNTGRSTKREVNHNDEDGRSYSPHKSSSHPHRAAAATASVVGGGVAEPHHERAGSEKKGGKGGYQLKNVHAGPRRSPNEAGK